MEILAVLFPFGLIPIDIINTRVKKKWPKDLFSLLNSGQLDNLNGWYNNLVNDNKRIDRLKEKAIPVDQVVFGPLYRNPSKIWGIGLNYQDHAADLSEKTPIKEPASFMKPATTIIGLGDTVLIPELSDRTTGEAELGIIFGQKCKNVPEKQAFTVIAGFTAIIDMTAEDILKRNPRNLTQSKSFDTFFSFGPVFYTPDEVKDLKSLKVSTVLNGNIIRENRVNNMTFPPEFLISYHSQIMTMLPGDIISTGTPGAVPLKQGDIIECQITNFHPLKNRVIDLKNK